MNENLFIQNGFKVDALKMIDGAVFKHLIEVAKNRMPEYAHSSNDLHTVALQAKMREGYELAINTIINLPREEVPEKANDYEQVLLDPRD